MVVKCYEYRCSCYHCADGTRLLSSGYTGMPAESFFPCGSRVHRSFGEGLAWEGFVRHGRFKSFTTPNCCVFVSPFRTALSLSLLWKWFCWEDRAERNPAATRTFEDRKEVIVRQVTLCDSLTKLEWKCWRRYVIQCCISIRRLVFPRA